jgi:ribosomal 50S subunit-associated protein YjgA (DUF615 family)
MATDTDPSTARERPSKSQRKRDMTELQDIGTRLVLLSADQPCVAQDQVHSTLT